VRIKRYHLALASDLEKLQNEVNKLLAEGWQPSGQFVVIPPSTASEARFLQVMVQYEGEIRS
jgi:hypothetical protein